MRIPSMHVNGQQQQQSPQLLLQPPQPQSRELIGAIDQGTSSTRFLVFENLTGRLIASSQQEIKRIVPCEGWVEIDPNAIMESVHATIQNVSQYLRANNSAALDVSELKCVGICNQRESTVVWDKISGKPLYNVIVWMDNRTKDLVDDMIDKTPGRDFNWLKDKTGLPMSTYFSAFKLKWLIDNVEEVKLALKSDRLMFGTVDSWILWNLTGQHMTDVTNASRTFLVDIETLEWDKQLCKHFGVPMNILPKIRSSADQFGLVQHGPLKGLPITGVIGDQSAALFGHNCLQLGQTKATFGTGCFIMQNIGPGPLNGALSGVQREAKRGLITTVGYKLHDRPACYALEGSIKIAGAALTWLRDNLQLISDYDECDRLVNMTTHSAGVFFVPALGGLYSPYWDPNAAGLYIGLSQFSRREHLVRATFDSIAFQTNDILSLMRGVANGLMIDGGLCKSENLCQILADITGYDIVRPSMCETSALGAAMVAGCGANIWPYEQMLANSHTPYEYTCDSNQTHHYPQTSLHHDAQLSGLIRAQSEQARQQQEKQSSANNVGLQVAHLSRASSASPNNIDQLTANDDAGGGVSAAISSTRRPGDMGDDEDTTSGHSLESVDEIDDELDADYQADVECIDCETAAELADFNGLSGASEAPLAGRASAAAVVAGANGRLIACDSSQQERLRRSHTTPSSGYCSSGDNYTSELTNQRDSPVSPNCAPDGADTASATDDCYYSDLEEPKQSGQAGSAVVHPVDVFQSYIPLEHRTELVNSWRRAVERSMKWTKIQHEELRRIDYQRLSSLPISMYLFLSLGMVALSSILSAR